jgi:L-aminopeptidase/D-esterase-like protein
MVKLKTPIAVRNALIVNRSAHHRANNRGNQDKYQQGKFKYAIVFHAIVYDTREKKRHTANKNNLIISKVI